MCICICVYVCACVGALHVRCYCELYTAGDVKVDLRGSDKYDIGEGTRVGNKDRRSFDYEINL